MKNYYEILEVSSNASPEVIEKAYKALVKKYHPDLQPENLKQTAENKIKSINEAYDTLSNKEKKLKYDELLNAQKAKEQQTQYSQSNKSTQNNTSNPKNSYINAYYNSLKNKPNSNTQNNDKLKNDYTKIMNEAYTNAYNNAYNQAYINTLKNMGYEIKYERPFKEKLRIFIATILAFAFLGFICFLLWHIPFIRNYFTELYYTNDIFKILVDLLNNIFTSFISLFKN